MNIIHIISDTFRRDNLEIYGGKGYSPALTPLQKNVSFLIKPTSVAIPPCRSVAI